MKAPQFSVKNQCPVCNHSDSQAVFKNTSVAVHRLKYYSTRQQALNAPTGEMDYRFCNHCGTMWNALFDTNIIDYNQDYALERGCSFSFRKHLNAMGDFVASVLSPNDPVIELGCGNGNFLTVLEEKGFTKLKGYDTTYRGTDPRILREYLDVKEYADDSVKLYALRHVIEHISEPYDFLASLANASPQAYVFLETPCLDWIFNSFSFSDFYYEHCQYFSLETFKQLFSDITIHTCFDDQYICLIAPLNSFQPREKIQRCVADNFLVPDFTLSQQQAQKFVQNNRCIVWGAGQNGIGFIEFTDPTGDLIPCIIDINPALSNTYLAAIGTQVLAPEKLADKTFFQGNETILVNNSNYLNEVIDYLQSIHWQGNVSTIDRIMSGIFDPQWQG